MVFFNIKNVRKSKGISLRKLHNLTGISRSYLLDLETNRRTNPSMFVLETIANALNVNIKDLFYSNLDLNMLKQIMYERMDRYGTNAKEVLEISEIIDILVNLEMQNQSFNKSL